MCQDGLRVCCAKPWPGRSAQKKQGGIECPRRAARIRTGARGPGWTRGGGVGDVERGVPHARVYGCRQGEKGGGVRYRCQSVYVELVTYLSAAAAAVAAACAPCRSRGESLPSERASASAFSLCLSLCLSLSLVRSRSSFIRILMDTGVF